MDVQAAQGDSLSVKSSYMFDNILKEKPQSFMGFTRPSLLFGFFEFWITRDTEHRLNILFFFSLSVGLSGNL